MPELERTKLATGRTARSNCSPDKIANVKNTFQHARARAHTLTNNYSLSLSCARSPSLFLSPPPPPSLLHPCTYRPIHTQIKNAIFVTTPLPNHRQICAIDWVVAGTANGTTTYQNALVSLGRRQPQAGCDDAVTWRQPQAGTGVRLCDRWRGALP